MPIHAASEICTWEKVPLVIDRNLSYEVDNGGGGVAIAAVHVDTFKPLYKEAVPAESRLSVGPGGRVPTIHFLAAGSEFLKHARDSP